MSLGYTLAFSVCKQKFVQILNVNNNHWNSLIRRLDIVTIALNVL